MVNKAIFKIMDLEKLEQRLDDLEQTIEQLADDQSSLSETIDTVTETQLNMIDNQEQQFNDYGALIIYIIGFIAWGWTLSSFNNSMNQISNTNEDVTQRIHTVDSLYIK
ncbi:MAG: hypothetical protein AAFQ80_12895 [Cyanobacteria bacterium J06621_8]